MKVEIKPSKACGKAIAPPSKSIAHRALICGALSSGSKIENVNFSDDITATISCLRSLGAEIDILDNVLNIGNLDLTRVSDGAELYCNESGSTLRFLIPLCLLTGKRIVLKGSKRLFERPLKIYENICKEQGCLFELNEGTLTVCGKIKNGFYRIPGNISSQFITGLLFALPLIEGTSIIEIFGKFESASYIDLTLDTLRAFGIRIIRAENRFIINGNQRYNDASYTVEGDCSNAAFLEALNFLGGEVEIKGVLDNSKQGDRIYRNYFQDLKTGVKEFDLSDCPDLAPVMFSLAAVIGDVKFTGTERLKIKESDRATAMQKELKKFGVSVDVERNSVYVHKNELIKPTISLFGHNDHRIVMALAVLSTLTGATIEGAEAIAKSYPAFFETLKSLKIGIIENDS